MHRPGLEPQHDQLQTMGGQKRVGVSEMLMDEDACSFLFVPFLGESIMTIFCVYWKNLFIFICDFVYFYSFGKNITIFLLLFYCLCKLQL